MSRRAALITLLITLVLAWGSLAVTLSLGVTPRLGLDLRGGYSVLLVAPEGTDSGKLDQAVEIMQRRIEALGGVQEPEIAKAGENTIEVQLPGVTDRTRAEEAVGATGQLVFRPVLTVNELVSPLVVDYYVWEQENASTTTTAPEGSTTTAAEGSSTTAGDSSTSAATTTTSTAATTTTAAGGTTSAPTTTAAGGTTTTTTTAPAPPPDLTKVLPEGISLCDPEVEMEQQLGCVDGDPESATFGLTLREDPDKEAWLANPTTGEIFHLAPAAVRGEDLADAQAGYMQGGSSGGVPFGVSGAGVGQWVVYLDFTEAGAVKFQETTKVLASYPDLTDNRRRFAIVLDGEVKSAPSMAEDVSPQTGIAGGRAVITMGQTNAEQEARDLAVVLRYGALPVVFETLAAESISATLGSDSLNAGLMAGAVGLALVAVAMVLYYRALGLINVIGLTVFGSIVLVVFSLLGEYQGVSLTLAGVAGVIVSIGITADSYIVYYERIKEEVRAGRSMRVAVDHAFKRAFRTMVTADMVSLAASVLLFILAVGSVKGFALALGIATVTDLVVAYFFTRPAVALAGYTRLGEGGRFSIRGAAGVAREGAAKAKEGAQ